MRITEALQCYIFEFGNPKEALPQRSGPVGGEGRLAVLDYQAVVVKLKDGSIAKGEVSGIEYGDEGEDDYITLEFAGATPPPEYRESIALKDIEHIFTEDEYNEL